MASYKHGDIFAIPLGNGTYVTGRILLDVKQQCVKPKLIEDSSPLAFYNSTLLVEIYCEIHEQPQAKQSPSLITSIFTGPERLRRGDWPIVGHAAVDPKTVEFPETVNAFSMKTYLMRGELMLPLGPGIEGWNGIAINPNVPSEHLLADICLFYLGQVEQIDPRKRQAVQLANKDLRFHPQRDEVYAHLGLDATKPYYALALRHGFDTARFYAPPKKNK